MSHPKRVYAAQGVAALIMLMAAGMKFIADPSSVELFTRLGMEPAGRYVIAVTELAAALLLISRHAALGSVVAISVMCGALIAHTTQLGVAVGGDGGRLFALLIVEILSATYVLVSRRHELPFVGKTLR